MMGVIFKMLFGRRLARQTSLYLDHIESAPIRASIAQTTQALTTLSASGSPTVPLGMTTGGQPVAVPLAEVLTSHALVTGGSGAGKSYFALGVMQSLLAQLPQTKSFGFGVVDPKGEIFFALVYLLAQRLADLDRSDARAAAELRERIVIIDFAAGELAPVSPYNLLYRSPGVDPDFFADSRTDQLLDLLPGRDNLSLNGSALLRRMILLLAQLSLPLSILPSLLNDEELRRKLVGRYANKNLGKDFERQFASTPKQTIFALSRRFEALFSSRSVRLALDGTTAPDFRALQDDGKIVLVNCFGANLARSVRQLLQAVVVGDVSQSVFARRRKERPFLWFLDEAQNCFLTPRLRDQMADLLTQARSFGSFFLSLTQNISTAVHDSGLLNQLYTNIKWSFSMRGQPADCAFLKSALPVTARKLRPLSNPFEPASMYTITEERAIELDSIANLPNRVGFLWLRSHCQEAFKITTLDIPIPHGDLLESAIKPLLSDPAIGARLSRQAYEVALTQSSDIPQESAPADMSNALADAYKRTRGSDV